MGDGTSPLTAGSLSRILNFSGDSRLAEPRFRRPENTSNNSISASYPHGLLCESMNSAFALSLHKKGWIRGHTRNPFSKVVLVTVRAKLLFICPLLFGRGGRKPHRRGIVLRNRPGEHRRNRNNQHKDTQNRIFHVLTHCRNERNE